MDISQTKQIDFCEERLMKIIRDIEPSDNQKDGAKRSHNNLREVLDSGKMKNCILDSYLSGSYKRDTAIKPLEDVDIIFIIRADAWSSRLISPGPNPMDVLQTFSNAIRYRYPESSLRFQRRSIRLQLNHIDIDIVPAICDSEDTRKIWIPDTEDKKWIVTSPKIHEEITIALNKKLNGCFKPIVKLLKRWNNSLPESVSFKSFALETMATRLFQNISFDSYTSGVLYFFDFIAALGEKLSNYNWKSDYEISLGYFSQKVPDCTGIGGNTIAGISYGRVEKFISHSVRSRDKLIAALNARYTENSIQRINEIFGF